MQDKEYIEFLKKHIEHLKMIIFEYEDMMSNPTKREEWNRLSKDFNILSTSPKE